MCDVEFVSFPCGTLIILDVDYIHVSYDTFPHTNWGVCFRYTPIKSTSIASNVSFHLGSSNNSYEIPCSLIELFYWNLKTNYFRQRNSMFIDFLFLLLFPFISPFTSSTYRLFYLSFSTMFTTVLVLHK